MSEAHKRTKFLQQSWKPKAVMNFHLRFICCEDVSGKCLIYLFGRTDKHKSISIRIPYKPFIVVKERFRDRIQNADCEVVEYKDVYSNDFPKQTEPFIKIRFNSIAEYKSAYNQFKYSKRPEALRTTYRVI
jgi:hypothetical protein